MIIKICFSHPPPNLKTHKAQPTAPAFNFRPERTYFRQPHRLRPLIIKSIIMMEQKVWLNCEPPASRRSRKDEEGRDFQCGCGKRYLSYPALYTHIKTKHDGRQPEGTQKTGNGIAAKRSKGRLEEDTLRAVHGYLEKNDLQLLSELDEKHFGTVPLHARIKKDALPKEMGECYGALLKQQDCKLTPRSSLDLVLTVYLLNVGEYVNDKLFDHYLMFARLVRSCFHDCAEEVHRQCFAAQATPASPAFSLAECRFFPIICDFLLRYYLPTSDYKELNLSLIELMLYDFCRWMLRNALTHVKVQLKKEYRLMVKPTAIARPKCVRQAKGESEEEPKEEDEEDSEEELEEEEDEEDKKDGIEVERDNNAEMQEEVHVTAPQQNKTTAAQYTHAPAAQQNPTALVSPPLPYVQ